MEWVEKPQPVTYYLSAASSSPSRRNCKLDTDNCFHQTWRWCDRAIIAYSTRTNFFCPTIISDKKRFFRCLELFGKKTKNPFCKRWQRESSKYVHQEAMVLLCHLWLSFKLLSSRSGEKQYTCTANTSLAGPDLYYICTTPHLPWNPAITYIMCGGVKMAGSALQAATHELRSLQSNPF